MALTHLVDTSVLTRLAQPAVREAVEPRAERGELARAGISDLEIGFSPRSEVEWDRLVGALDVFDLVESTSDSLALLEVVGLERVCVWRSGPRGRTELLRDVDWVVRRGERWVVAGPNGAGKSTLLRIASAHMRPSSGIARVLGRQLGGYPLAELRRHVGVVDPALGRRFYPGQRALDVVLTGAAGTVLNVEDADDGRARAALALVGAGELAERLFVSCSEGERTRILLARALVADAALLVLDEPAAGLDLPGRLLLAHALGEVLAARPELTTITVTHELDALPQETTHLLLLADGAAVAAGALGETLTAANVAACFGVPLEVARRIGT